MKLFFTILILFIGISSQAQHLFPTKFEGCNTNYFSLENDTKTAKLSNDAFLKILKDNIDKSKLKKVRGSLQLQIIVDEDGNSCLLSVKNDTNTSLEKLGLKRIIDEKVKWNIKFKKVAVIVFLQFKKRKIKMKRIGMGNQGLHILKD